LYIYTHTYLYEHIYICIQIYRINPWLTRSTVHGSVFGLSDLIL